jgi:hypothetical protein
MQQTQPKEIYPFAGLKQQARLHNPDKHEGDHLIWRGASFWALKMMTLRSTSWRTRSEMAPEITLLRAHDGDEALAMLRGPDRKAGFSSPQSESSEANRVRGLGGDEGKRLGRISSGSGVQFFLIRR